MPGIPWSKRLFSREPDSITPSEAGLYDPAEIAHPENAMMLMCVFSRTPGTTVEDVAVTTHHFVNYTGGAVDPTWDSGDFTTVETAMDTFWTTMKTKMTPTISLTQYRWYEKSKDTQVPGVENPPQRVTTKAIVGSSGGAALPPQVAVSVTEKVSARKSWGRFYIPGVTASILDLNEGRIANADVDTIANTAKTLYEACATAELVPIVWSTVRGHGYAVERIQVDDIFDVIRRRRWDKASYRKSFPV